MKKFKVKVILKNGEPKMSYVYLEDKVADIRVSLRRAITPKRGRTSIQLASMQKRTVALRLPMRLTARTI